MLADEEISRTPLVFGMSLVFRVSQVFDFFQPLEGGDALENSEKSTVSRFFGWEVQLKAHFLYNQALWPDSGHGAETGT